MGKRLIIPKKWKKGLKNKTTYSSKKSNVGTNSLDSLHQQKDMSMNILQRPSQNGSNGSMNQKPFGLSQKILFPHFVKTEQK